jgi:pimeloyl-ACP methyl ester carboxylesterase
LGLFSQYFWGISAAGSSSTSAWSLLSLFLSPGAWARVPLLDRLPRERQSEGEREREREGEGEREGERERERDGLRFPPTHLLYGEHDWMDSQAGLSLSLSLSSSLSASPSSFDLVPSSGHYLFMDAPAETAKVILDRLEESVGW